MSRRTLRRRAALGAVAAGAALALAPSALATFPGENGLIAFSRGGDIWTISPDGLGERQLTFGAEHTDVAPEWSLDGTELLFQRTGNAGPHIYRMTADGSNPTWIVPGSSPQFSRDGTRIAYDNGNPALILANRDGSNPKQLHDDTTPRDWSPVNDLIIETQHEISDAMGIPSEHGVFLNALTDLSDERNMTLRNGSWAPDGQRLAVSAYWSLLSPCDPDCAKTPNPDLGINVVEIDGRRKVIRSTGSDPTWSPDGHRIVFVEGDSIKIMDADGTILRVLAKGSDPDWQPVAPAPPPPPPEPTVVTVTVPVQVPGPERVVETTVTKVVTKVVTTDGKVCPIPASKRRLALTIRTTRAIKKGTSIKVWLNLESGRANVEVPKNRPLRVVAR